MWSSAAVGMYCLLPCSLAFATMSVAFGQTDQGKIFGIGRQERLWYLQYRCILSESLALAGLDNTSDAGVTVDGIIIVFADHVQGTTGSIDVCIAALVHRRRGLRTCQSLNGS